MKFSGIHRGILYCGGVASLLVFLFAPTDGGQFFPLFQFPRPRVGLAYLVAAQGAIAISTLLPLMMVDWVIRMTQDAQTAEDAAAAERLKDHL
jgi:hypothetical protein